MGWSVAPWLSPEFPPDRRGVWATPRDGVRELSEARFPVPAAWISSPSPAVSLFFPLKRAHLGSPCIACLENIRGRSRYFLSYLLKTLFPVITVVKPARKKNFAAN